MKISVSCLRWLGSSPIARGAAALACGLALSSPARADDDLWGCQVLLCMSNPAGPTAVAECVPPISRLWRHLRRGRPFPSCSQAGFEGGNVKYDPWRCPEAGEEGGEDTSWVLARRWDPDEGVNAAWCVSLVNHVDTSCPDPDGGAEDPNRQVPCRVRHSIPALRHDMPHYIDLPSAGPDGGPGRVRFRMGRG